MSIWINSLNPLSQQNNTCMCIQDYHYWWSVMYSLGATIQTCPVRLYFLRSLHHSNQLKEIIPLVQCSAPRANQLRLGVDLWDLTNEVTWRQVRIHTSKNEGSNRIQVWRKKRREETPEQQRSQSRSLSITEADLLTYPRWHFLSAALHTPASLTHSCCESVPPSASNPPQTYLPAQHHGLCTPAWGKTNTRTHLKALCPCDLPPGFA